MALVSDSIPYMVQGISQQPDEVRRTYQGAIQINAQSSLVDGLNKRPPTEHVAKLLTNSASNVASHLIDRGVGSRFVLILQSDNTLAGTSLKIFDVTNGTESTVTVSTTDLSYLVCANPRDDIRFLTVLSKTYILNKNSTTAMATTRSPNVTFSEVQRFSDLSSSAAVGSIHKIVGDSDDKFSTFFVEKTASTSVFEETVAPNTFIQIDAATMPHQLTQSGSNFTFNTISWSQRTVGDTDTNKDPSFIGKKITSLFFFKNRFGVTADEKVVFSESGEFDNFFRTSVTSPSDSDPIDVDVTHTRVSKVEHAIPFNEQLLLFSQQSQFFIESNGALSSDSISINPASHFEMDVDMPPVAAGVNVYFAQVSGGFSRIRELFVATDLDTHDAADITAHVPKFIPKNVYRASASTSEDIIYFLSADTPSRIYCYKYNWAGTDKNQSAWSFFEYNSQDTILWMETVENKTFMLVSRSDGVFLEFSDYLVPADANLTFNARLDRKVSLTGSYNSGTDTTTWTLPYEVPTSTPVVAVRGATVATSVTKTVTVVDPGGGNKFFIDGVQQATLNLTEGNTYIFNYPSAHPFRLSTTADGTHGGGSEFTTGVTHNSSTQLTFVVPTDAPPLFYYCANHSGMGGIANTPAASSGANSGTTVTTTRPSVTTVVASGDHSGSSFFLGLEYEMRYRFSTQYVREGSGLSTVVGEKMARNEGRLQLRRWQVTYRDTGFFNIEVQPKGRPLKTYEFTSAQVNLPSAQPDRVSLDSGTFRFPIMARNTDVTVDIKTSSYLPAQFTQAEWEGNYSVQTRRL